MNLDARSVQARVARLALIQSDVNAVVVKTILHLAAREEIPDADLKRLVSNATRLTEFVDKLLDELETDIKDEPGI